MTQQTLIAGLLGALLITAWPLGASAHTHLEKSDPADKASLSAAPASVQLWFSDKVAAEWSKIVVTDAAGKRVDQEKVAVDETDPKHIRVDLNPITSGKYKVDWNVISGDGHRVKGSFSFSVQ
ncbi:MAG: copper homeostasis periplasmic binding protein CopC [Gammaproteobacteria bacterium]|nr:copper homeostasis periplasmic binding protein CopC [Gammaproteobacteria bacterium]